MKGKILRRLWIRLTHWDACPFLFSHRPIRTVQTFGVTACKLRCDGCGKYFAMSHEHQAVLPWDDELEDLYANMLGYGRTIR